MSWNYDRSRERVEAHLDAMGAIEVEPLTRDADLDRLLSETRCREITGAHVYVNVSNFARLASEGSYADSVERLIQGVHIYQREVTRLVRSTRLFDEYPGYPVHFQGPKLHALFFRPIADDEVLATSAAVLQLVLRDFVKHVFNPAFPHYDNFSVAGGADLGDAIGTKNGARGDRELLFLGDPANHAAKIIRGNGVLRVTGRVYDALPDVLQGLCTPVGDGADYRLAMLEPEELDEVLDELGVVWDRDTSAARVADDKKRFPLKDITYSGATELIDLDALGVYRSKRVTAASVFADVSGFTRYVEGATTAEEREAALRVFHAIRRELARVIRRDFGGLRVQYQGDRVQGLFHLPADDVAAIATRAVDAAVGLQSSMEHTLKALLPEAAPLSLAIGVDVGTTLVSKLGTRGQRDRICLGESVEAAAACEERIAGGQIGVSAVVHDVLPERLQAFFAEDTALGCYVAMGLTAEKVERATRAKTLYTDRQAPAYVRSGAPGAVIAAREAPDARAVVPAKRYAR
jgi:class 3 adenylate cyclase